MKMKLGELLNIRTGKLDANAANENGQYPFFTCSKEPLSINTYSYDCECVLVAGNGDLNVKYYNGKFDAYQRTYILESNSNKLYMPYLYFFMDNYVDTLRKQSIGGVIKYIKLENITNASIELPEVNSQKEICTKIYKVKGLINKQKKTISYLDTLIKARFVEMFGDLEINHFNWNIVNISTILTDKASNGYFAKKEDYDLNGNAKVLGVVNIVNTLYSNLVNMPVVNAKETDIEKYAVRYGDVLFCRSSLVAEGIGKASVVPKDVDNNVLFECHVIRLRLDIKRIVPEFLQVLTTMDYFRNQILRSAKTATMTTIGQEGILKCNIILPPIDKQNDFLSFINQIYKLKVA